MIWTVLLSTVIAFKGFVDLSGMRIKSHEIVYARLNGVETPVSSSYEFEFADKAGTFLLELDSVEYVFPRYLIKIKNAHLVILKIHFDVGSGEKLDKLVCQPIRVRSLVHTPAPYSFSSFLTNPMTYMIGLPLTSMLLLPKLMENLDEDILKEMQDNQAQNQFFDPNVDFSSKITSFLAGTNE